QAPEPTKADTKTTPPQSTQAESEPAKTRDDTSALGRGPTALLLAGLLPAPVPGEEVTLVPVSYDQFRAHLAANRAKAKYTLVDAWASDCAPCKENFPHLIAMHRKYGPQGLAVVSLTLDDPEDAKAVAKAKQFLQEQKATFTNFLMNEEAGVGYEKLNINAIPAVFVFGPDGKEVQRFTMDDPDNQFTYEEVDRYVDALLKGKPLPPEKGRSSR
ncbi:MAG: TlpA family protein disulfide reductase, partial [Isosphaeraceae bacterium]|nr:TlpA family protein disulfide reductase [Isosphaeraceae bacterium]